MRRRLGGRRRGALIYRPLLPPPRDPALLRPAGADVALGHHLLRQGPARPDPAACRGRDTEPVAFAAHLSGAAYGFLFKQYDLRWSRLLAAVRTRRRPRLRIFSPEPPAPAAARQGAAAPARADGAGVRRPVRPLPRRAARRPARRGPRQDRPRGPRRPDRGGEPHPPGGQPSGPATAGATGSDDRDPDPIVRDARPDDRDAIVAFNARLAEETEAKRLDPSVLARGVARALADPDRLRYWVAERDGRVVGQAAVTREWSDWRYGWIWWFQSVYVAPEARGLGVFRALHADIREAALDAGDVIGLRLYVEEDNHRGPGDLSGPRPRTRRLPGLRGALAGSLRSTVRPDAARTGRRSRISRDPARGCPSGRAASAARPESIASAARSTPAAGLVGQTGDDEGGGGVGQDDVADRARLAAEHRAGSGRRCPPGRTRELRRPRRAAGRSPRGPGSAARSGRPRPRAPGSARRG